MIHDPGNQKTGRGATRLIVGMMVGWALLLAIGTLIYGQMDVRRALFALVAIGIFPLIWIVALRWAPRR